MSISAAVEEADIELCASGFDNLVMYGDLDELHQHASNMKLLGAMKCHAVINELIAQPSHGTDWFEAKMGWC